MIDDEVIKTQLGKTLDRTSFHELGSKYEAKVRDCYVRDGRRTLIALALSPARSASCSWVSPELARS